MTKSQEAKLKKLGVFTLKQAEKIGLKQPAISKLVMHNKLNRVGHGIYIHPEGDISQTVGYQITQAKFGPKSAIGGLSALAYYNLIEQVPSQTWVIVEPHIRSYEKSYRLIRTKVSQDVGIKQEKGYRIVTIERALIEGLKLASKIGERTALTAIRTALSKRTTTLRKIGDTARLMGYDNILTKYFEAIVA